MSTKMVLTTTMALLLLACGGGDGTETETMGTAKSAILTSPAPMLDKRSDAAATVLSDGRILITGGRNATAYVKTTEIYNPTTNTWTAAAATLADHTGGTALTLKDGRVLVIGGTETSSTFVAELFDGTTWTAVGGVTMPRLPFVRAFVLSDGSVAVFGGDPSDSSSAGNRTKTYIYTPNTGTGTWATGKFSTYTHNFGAHTKLDDDSILLVGGISTGTYTGYAERYVPSTNTWIDAGSIVKRTQSFAVTVPGGALVLGGRYTTTAMTDVEFYNAATNTWTAMTPCLGAHQDTVAVRLPSGAIYLPSGGDKSAELYDLKTDKWVSTDAFPTIRARHSTALVGSDVYILGGQTTAGTFSEPIATVTKYRQPRVGETCAHTIECATGTCSGGVCVASDAGPSDTGAPPTDTGTTTDTGSSTTTDTGSTATTDTGVTPSDSGTPSTDSGASTDSAVASDTGETADADATDTGLTTADSGSDAPVIGHADSGPISALGDTGPNCEDHDAEFSAQDYRRCFGEPLTFDAKACQAAPGSTGSGSILGGLLAALTILLRRRTSR